MDLTGDPVLSGLSGGYPAQFEADVVLADGGTARVRPIRPDDSPLLVAFHERQSPESIYFRYFSPRPRLSDRDVERFTNVDYLDRFALIALRAGELIGVARYDRWRHLEREAAAWELRQDEHAKRVAERRFSKVVRKLPNRGT